MSNLKATIKELLATQARQLDNHCEGLSEDAAAELRRRIKLRTGVFPRPEILVDVAYVQIPRGGDIENERAVILDEFQRNAEAILFGGPVPQSPESLLRDGVAAHLKLKRFMSKQQWEFVKTLMKGEEGAFFQSKMCELATLIDTIPRTYDQEKAEEGETKFFLHYFKGSADWYIAELDRGTKGDSDEDFMVQCYGYADLFGQGPVGGAEHGYVSIPEIVANGAELDFHFTPGPLPSDREAEAEEEIREIEGDQT